MHVIWTLALGLVVALSAGTPGKAEAFNPPGYACTASSEGQLGDSFSGRHKYQWICHSGTWVFLQPYYGDQYGNNCIAL